MSWTFFIDINANIQIFSKLRINICLICETWYVADHVESNGSFRHM